MVGDSKYDFRYLALHDDPKKLAFSTFFKFKRHFQNATSIQINHWTPQQDPVATLGTLQLRRLLRAVGLLTEDLARERLQERLVEKVREAIAAGRFAAYIEKQRVVPKDSFQCGESCPSSSGPRNGISFCTVDRVTIDCGWISFGLCLIRLQYDYSFNQANFCRLGQQCSRCPVKCTYRWRVWSLI